MIETPDYWLTPCLVALAAWINDDKEFLSLLDEKLFHIP